jgi:murein DD-endopeptidase MepM/ murein hydrolase activator NlpD
MEVENVNSKKLFPEKKLLKKSLLEFIEKKGFYVILILCVAVIGATAVFLSTKDPTSNSDPKIISETEVDSTTAIDKSGPVQSTINTADTAPADKAVANVPVVNEQATTQKDTVKPPDNTIKSTPAPSKSTKKAVIAQTQKFIKPVFGEVSFDFSNDKLVYSKTLEEWRTHSGVDLAAERGTPVKAVSDGVVSEIKNDPRFGIMIVLDHQNGLKTLYSNLASEDMVTPNQIIKQGEVIGSVGNTAIIEASEQSHLHFEVWKKNKVVDPVAYLPAK